MSVYFDLKSWIIGLIIGLAGKPLQVATEMPQELYIDELINTTAESTSAINTISMLIGWDIGLRLVWQQNMHTDDVVATLDNGVLYIKNAYAILNNGVLEVN